MSVSVAPSRKDQCWPGQVKSDLGRRWPSALGDPLIRWGASPFSQAPLHGGFADAQMGGRPTDRAEALDGGSHGLDLMAAHGSLQRLVRGRATHVLDKEIARQALEPDLVLACGDGEALNDVAQFSNVARPSIAQKTIHHRSGEAAREAVTLVDLLQETVGEGGDVLRPLPERGNIDWDGHSADDWSLSRVVMHAYLGDFEASRQYAKRGLQLWRSGNVQSHTEDPYTPGVACLCYLTLSEWQLGEIASCQANMDEAMSIAKELKNMNALAMALAWATVLGQCGRNPAEVDHWASDLIELSARHKFIYWLAFGAILRGWARSASGDTAEGIQWIEHGIRDSRATGPLLTLPYYLGLKAEALYLADRSSEALEAIKEAEKVVERSEERHWCAELHRLRGVFLTATGAEKTQIDASFCEAIRIAKEQKSISLATRAEATYAEYRRQKASASEGCGFRLPLW
jgi:tetratricopeptide (TPR) repeat protein